MHQEKDRVRAKELYRQMSRREKAKYLWEYYRLPALGVLLAAAAVVSLALALTAGQRTKKDVHLGAFGVPGSLTAAAERLAQDAGWDGGLVTVTGPSIDGDDGSALIQITCLLSADELDAVLCDRATADFILQESEVPGELTPLSRTALASEAPEGAELFLLLVKDTGRADKLPAFARILGVESDLSE